MTKIIFMLIYLIYSISSKSEVLQCGDQQIKDCEKCGSGNVSDTCIQCKDKHFLFFNNYYCLPCDDPLYGQISCGGNCDGSRYNETRNVLCNENDCKEGYYNLNGICYSCSEGSYGCKKCIMELENDEKKFKCLECINNEFLLDKNNNRCYYCYKSYCSKCHYSEDQISICDKCYDGFYLNSENECKKCKNNIIIPNGICRVCSDNETDYKSGNCSCNSYYTLNDNSICVPCPDNCSNCEFNKLTKKAECTICNSGFVIDNNKTCSFCGEGCEYCILNDLKNPVCFYCFSKAEDGSCIACPDNCKRCEFDEKGEKKCLECNPEYTLNNNGICVHCPSNCRKCNVTDKNKIVCTECYEDYALNPDGNEQCKLCSSITEIGGKGCEKCGYNIQTSKYECYKCKKEESKTSYELYDVYTFVNNTYQCFNNSDPNDTTFYGCMISSYNKETDKYECLKCLYNSFNGYFIPIVNEKICKNKYDIYLWNCDEAENIGTKEDPIYSCLKCYDYLARVITSENRTICENRYNKLVYCLEGVENNNYENNCTTCVKNAHLNNSNLCECDNDSFSKNSEYCYKCDDKYYGNPGCDASKGCNYFYSNGQFNCNQCKKGYFNYSYGQCFSCSAEINNCEECHYNESINRLICDKCIDGYTYDSNKKKCELKNCEDYPEICEGCILCEGKLEEFKPQEKCQFCKEDYFKTKEDKCIYCRAEEYGGPGCLKCKYSIDENGNETNNIQCEYCPKEDHALSSDGKCYKCRDYVSSNCDICGFKKNGDDKEKIACLLCNPGYYLNSEGECIDYSNYLKEITNCEEYIFKINNITFYSYYLDSIDYLYEYKYSFYNTRYYHYSNFYQYNSSYYYYINNSDYINISKIENPIKTECINCLDGYFLDNNGSCQKITIEEDCSLINIVRNFPQRYTDCYYYCYNYDNDYIFLDFLITKKNETNNKNNTIIFSITEFFDNYRYGYNSYNNKELTLSELDNDLKYLFINNSLCIKRPLDNFRNCKSVVSIKNNGTYTCSKCFSSSYILDNNSNNCYYEGKSVDPEFNCVIKNIGNDSNPLYSCTECRNDNYLLVSIENNAKLCKLKEEELKYCNETNANTTYINDKYNCSSCLINFLPFYSRFFERKICQNVNDKIITKKEISFNQFENVENITSKDGICESNLFTPDGEKCYFCNDNNIGMPGCKGACNFSLNRNNILKCISGCKVGYIETSEGICEPCGNVNQGCYECHYEYEYLQNYTKIKRNRRFVCNHCEDGYFYSEGKCLTCSDIGLQNCEQCEFNQNNNEYFCLKCEKRYYLSNGYCYKCNDKYRFQEGDNCYLCSNTYYGGISGCYYCEKNGDNLICQLCNEGYILLTNNNSCLNINENDELKKFDYCEKLTLDKNNNFYCTKKKKEYSLLIENNTKKCVKIPILYNNEVDENYYYYWDYYYYSDYYPSSYYYNDYNNFPCQEAINLGTQNKHIYSCSKCFHYFEYDKTYIDGNYFSRIITERNNVSICFYQNKKFSNCTEAINKTRDGIEKYDCLKCSDENKLVYDEDTGIHYCQYINTVKKCMVRYCKTCQNNNNFYCSECLLSNYAVNSITGSCVEKTEIVPAITWKDIFRFNLNSNKTINGRTIFGPSLMLRGITSSQINSRHAFLVYLTFKINAGRRILEEEEKKIPAICEISTQVKEDENKNISMVDYECIGNNSNNYNLTNYKLNKIIEGDNDGLLKKSNLEGFENVGDIANKEYPTYTIRNLTNTIVFNINQMENQTSENFTFDFRIDGKLDKDMEPIKFDTLLDLNEIEDKINCNFEVEKYNNASLDCILNIEKYKDYDIFSFKTLNIFHNEREIYLSRIDEIKLINGDKTKQNSSEGKEEEEKEEEEEEEDVKKGKNNDLEKIIKLKKDKEKSRKKAIKITIAVCIIGGILILGVVFYLLYNSYIKFFPKNQKVNNVINSASTENVISESNLRKD